MKKRRTCKRLSVVRVASIIYYVVPLRKSLLTPALVQLSQFTPKEAICNPERAEWGDLPMLTHSLTYPLSTHSRTPK